MPTIADEDRIAIVETFRRVLDDHHQESQLRTVMATDEGFDRELWARLGDLGILGLLTDEDYGGFGAGPVELQMLMEVAGEYLLCAPFLASSVIAASLVGQSDDADKKRELLPRIASGQSIATVAMTGDRGLWAEDDITVSARAGDGATVLDGTASFVLHGLNADCLLVLARHDGAIALFEVDPKAEGITSKPLPVNDPTLRISSVRFNQVAATPVSGVGIRELEKTLDLARIALAAENAGGARKIFEITIDYISNRFQFGRPVGGFQALKHMAADLLIEVESACSSARHAAQALASGSDEADILVPLASFVTADVFREVSAQAIQMHGGIAYTWEYPAHLYWRRARTNLWLLGSSDVYREKYLTALERTA